jgi:hypothetical protein
VDSVCVATQRPAASSQGRREVGVGEAGKEAKKRNEGLLKLSNLFHVTNLQTRAGPK